MNKLPSQKKISKIEFMIIDKMNINDYLENIVNIHRQSYTSNHLTNYFSKNLLKKYYHTLISSSSLTIISINKDRVIGFLISGDSFESEIKKFVNKNFIKIIFFSLKRPSILLSKIFFFFKFKILRSINSNIRLNSEAKFRLFSIAVSPFNQSLGIGSKLITYLEKKLVLMNVKMYGLSVKKDDINAINFYKRNNFVYEKNILDNDYYIKYL